MATQNPSTAFHTAVEHCCHEHQVASGKKTAIDLSSLVSKVEAAALAIEPSLVTGLQGADAISPAQYKPFIEAILAAVQAGVSLLPTPDAS